MTNYLDKLKSFLKLFKDSLRVGAIVPLGLVFLLFFLYLNFLLETNLKSFLEAVGTRLARAELTIDRLELRFSRPLVELYGLELTDRNRPTHNSFEFSRTAFGLSWDALLRGKVLITELAVEELKFSTERTTPGEILELDRAAGPSWLQRLVDWTSDSFSPHFSDAAIEQLEGTIFADIIPALDETTGLDQLVGEHQIIRDIDRFEEQLESDLQLVEELYADLPGDTELQKIDQNLKTLQQTRPESPQQVQRAVRQLQLLQEDLNRYKSQFNDSYRLSERKFRQLKNQLDSLQDEAALQRIELSDRFQLPEFELADFSTTIIKKMLDERFGWYVEAFSMIDDYLPDSTGPDSDDETAKTVSSKPADLGRNYSFPISTAYPNFWLQKANFSVDTEKGRAGVGKLLNFTSYPPAVGQPAIGHFSGNFPERGIGNLQVELLLDRSQSRPRDSIEIQLEDYHLTDWPFVNSDLLELGIQQARGEMKFTAHSAGDVRTVELDFYLTDLSFIVDAQSSSVTDRLKNAFRQIDQLELRAAGSSTDSQSSWSVSSNLDSQLTEILREQFSADLDYAREQAIKAFEGAYLGKINELEQELIRHETLYSEKLNQLEKRIESLIDDSLIDIEESYREHTGEKLDRQIDDLRQRWGF